MTNAASIEELEKAVAGLTVPKIFAKTVAAQATDPAIKWKDGDDWRQWTWQEYADLVARAAGGFQRLGLARGDRAVLMLRNIAEFHVADTALAHLGVCSVSIYNSSAPDQVQYLASHCEAKVAFVEDVGFLERFLKVRSELPDLERIVLLRDPDGVAPSDVMSWDELLDGAPADLASLVDIAQPDDLATLIYTSGTTGPPKAVMIDHHNIAYTSESLLRSIDQEIRCWSAISYLPMAHIAERMTGHYNQMRGGATIHCCPEASLIGAYAREVKPNIMFGVPRIWEKIHAGVMAFVAGQPDEQRAGIERALEVGRKMAEAQLDGGAIPADLTKAHEEAESVLAMGRSLVGLDDCRVAITGAAPISHEVLWFFRSLGVNLSEIYGMSECPR